MKGIACRIFGHKAVRVGIVLGASWFCASCGKRLSP